MKVIYEPTMHQQVDNVIDSVIDAERIVSHIELTPKEMTMFCKEISSNDNVPPSMRSIESLDLVIYRGYNIKRGQR